MKNPDTTYSCRSEAYEASENFPINPSVEPTFRDIVNVRFSRRDILKGTLGVTAMTVLAAGPLAALIVGRSSQAAGSAAFAGNAAFGFAEIAHGADKTHHVAPGYDADILIRWGDPVMPEAPVFDPYRQTAQKQRLQFGYNNDFIGYIPLPLGSNNAEHGLLCINHEYTDEEVMFPGLGKYDDTHTGVTKEITEIEMACNGGSIIEVKKVDGNWQVVPESRYARRITALDTEMRIAGPAAGHKRMKTSADPTGTRVIGTVNNCAGGITPWGTYLMAEENFHGYFWGKLDQHPKERWLDSNKRDAAVSDQVMEHPEAENFARYGIPENRYAWGKFHQRWNIHAEPHEANRFGWVVEVDPLDPTSMPVKRTALGRFKHEGAESIVNKDGRVVIYSGDDQRFDYLYKFVTDGRFDSNKRQVNRDLLDKGTLYVAKFNPNGTVDWLPLIFGSGGLTPENRFYSQADVLIETRRAADVLGATPMDRPEDVEPNPKTNKVYVMLTNNSKRQSDQLNAVNDRVENLWGQIVELTPPDDDHAAQTCRWDLLVKCGSPQNPATDATWHPATSANGWFSCPDNCAFDHQGRLWVTTDQGSAWAEISGTADGVWALETEGERRGVGKMFFRVPVGAEMCGPRFTPDGKTLFVAVQHPATDGVKALKGFERSSTFEDPATRWPDFNEKIPPRPSIVVITKKDGGSIGS
jgi:hypothetical protein